MSAFASKTHNINRLIEHIKKQQMAKDRSSDYKPSEAEKKERARLMSLIAEDLEMSEQELQVKLGINRSTWDRWKGMISIPHTTHLQGLERFGAEAASGSMFVLNLPRPLDILSASPWTYGRIRLVLGLYQWENAVFHFSTPFVDDKTVVDMATLALRGCKIIYLQNKVKGWAKEFIATMVLALGSTLAARALAQFCVIRVDVNSFFENFGILNYEVKDRDQSVGYIWKGNTENPSQPELVQFEQYVPFPSNDDTFINLNIKYASQLNSAFSVINERIRSEDVLPTIDRSTHGLYLTIPLVEEGQDRADIESLSLEVSDYRNLRKIIEEMKK